jgi:hypothetical protein
MNANDHGSVVMVLEGAMPVRYSLFVVHRPTGVDRQPAIADHSSDA